MRWITRNSSNTMKTESKIKLRSHLATHQETMAKLEALRQCSDLLVIHNKEAGIIDAYVRKNTSIGVFHAIQKPMSMNWIIREAEGMLEAV